MPPRKKSPRRAVAQLTLHPDEIAYLEEARLKDGEFVKAAMRGLSTYLREVALAGARADTGKALSTFARSYVAPPGPPKRGRPRRK